MVQEFIHDDQIILSFPGLRFVKKEDKHYISGDRETYYLYWNYKGADGNIKYDSKEQRDAIFDKIIKVIEKNKNRNKTE